MPIMTEEEARETWCPFANFPQSDDLWNGTPGVVQRLVPVNRLPGGWGGGVPPEARCLGSKCAVWAWEVAPKPAEEPDPAAPPPDKPPAAPTGRCGLAAI